METSQHFYFSQAIYFWMNKERETKETQKHKKME